MEQKIQRESKAIWLRSLANKKILFLALLYLKKTGLFLFWEKRNFFCEISIYSNALKYWVFRGEKTQYFKANKEARKNSKTIFIQAQTFFQTIAQLKKNPPQQARHSRAKGEGALPSKARQRASRFSFVSVDKTARVF